MRAKMVVRSYEELDAWQLADRFKTDVFRIVRSSSAAERDFKYRSQILDAASAVPKDIAEGFSRFSPWELMRYLDYALGSLAEAKERLKDGVQLGYFGASQCVYAFQFGERCRRASLS